MRTASRSATSGRTSATIWRDDATPRNGLSTIVSGTTPDVKRGMSATPSPASMNASMMRMSLKRWLTVARRTRLLLDGVQDALERVPVRHAEPGLVDEVGRHEMRSPREAVVGAHADVERLGEQWHGGEAATAPWQYAGHGVREHDVVLGGEVGELGQFGIEVGGLHDESGDGLQLGEHPRQQCRAHGRKGQQRDLAAGVVAELVPQRRRPLECDGDVCRAAGECLAGAREHEAATAAFGEGHSGLALEHLELLRDG